MDKIEKFLRSLSNKERIALLLILEQLQKDYTKIPGLKALQGKKHWYRIRMGNYRIIFSMQRGNARIQRITRRNENTYKDL